MLVLIYAYVDWCSSDLSCMFDGGMDVTLYVMIIQEVSLTMSFRGYNKVWGRIQRIIIFL